MPSRSLLKIRDSHAVGHRPSLAGPEQTAGDEIEPESYVSTFHAAQMLGVSVGTVKKMVEKNVLDAWKTGGGHRRISQHSIDTYRRQTFSETEPWAGTPKASARILFLDNDLETLQAARLAMERSSKMVAGMYLTTGLEAMMQMLAEPPDVIFCELSLTDLDGMELLRRLDKTPTTSKTNLVAWTSLDDATIASRGGLPAKTVLLRKPVHVEWLEGFLTALQLKTRS